MPAGDAAYAMRSEGFNSLVLAEWTDPAQTDPCTKWGRDSDAALQRIAQERYNAADLYQLTKGEASELIVAVPSPLAISTSVALVTWKLISSIAIVMS